MNSLFRFILGYSVLEICGAATGTALNRLANNRIPFWRVCWLDSLTVQICVSQRDAKQAVQIISSALCDATCLEEKGLRQSIGGLLNRPVLVFMILLDLLVAVLLPNFVLFYDVVGNETIPKDMILREISDLGIGVGTYGPNIRPHQIKNQLLYRLQELEWLTVVQNGCRAIIQVRERTMVPETESKKGFANVIAAQGGILTQQSIFAGQAQFQVGDTVKKGDVLVSGIVDLERIYVLENARAEIYARTWREKKVVIPLEYDEKTNNSGETCSVWLIIGRQRIKIFGNSGISYDSCDKMIKKMALNLPGGLSLPAALEIETYKPYDAVKKQMTAAEARALLTQYVEATVCQQMQAGQVLKRSYDLEAENNCFLLHATLECHEMIARTVGAKLENEDLFQ